MPPIQMHKEALAAFHPTIRTLLMQHLRTIDGFKENETHLTFPWTKEQMQGLLARRESWVGNVLRSGLLFNYQKGTLAHDRPPEEPFALTEVTLRQWSFKAEHMVFNRALLHDCWWLGGLLNATLCQMSEPKIQGRMDYLTLHQCRLEQPSIEASGDVWLSQCFINRPCIRSAGMGGRFDQCTFQGGEIKNWRTSGDPLVFHRCRFDGILFFDIDPKARYEDCVFESCKVDGVAVPPERMVEFLHAGRHPSRRGAGHPASRRSAVPGSGNPADAPDPGGAFSVD